MKRRKQLRHNIPIVLFINFIAAGSKLRVVTGRGIHSKGGKGARIRPAVINYLKEKKINVT